MTPANKLMFNSEESTQDKQESLELDRAREEHVKQIRKSNRDDIISKKRNLNPDLALIAEEGAKHQRLMLGDNELSDKIDKYQNTNADLPRRTIS